MKKIIVRSKPAVSIVAFLFATALQAQTSSEPNSSEVLEEIIVTAEKRAFSAQLTPVALTALTGDELTRNGIRSGIDLNGISPSLTAALSNGQLQLTMRGVGNEIVLSGVGEAGVAPHSNGVYLGSNVTATSAFFDVERIEIMRGPQGTLWGRNSTGGAINVIQNKPTDEFEAFLSADYGRFNALDLEGAVSGPVSEGVRGRVAIKHRSGDGYIENLSPGGDDLGDEDTLSLRASLDIDIGNTGNWLIAAGYSEWDIAARAVKQEGTAFAPGSTNPLGLPGDLSFAELSYGETTPQESFDTFSTNPLAGEEADLYYFTSELNFDLESFSLVFLTDYREHVRDYRLDGDFTNSSVESVFLDFDEEAQEEGG